MIFHWSLSDSKSPQVSCTLLSIMADLSNAVVWVVSSRPFISKFYSFFIKHLITEPRVLITTGVTITLMFHSFFQFLQGRGTDPSLRFHSLLLCGQSGQFTI